MSRRQDHINSTSLSGLLGKHPFLGIFQKENWLEYLELLAQIYDHIEDSAAETPFHGARVLAMKFYKAKSIQSVEAAVSQFFVMCLDELKALKDFHNSEGQRLIETTRSGKHLLQMVDQLLAEKVKFSGTGAETLLAALNEAVSSRQSFSKEEALSHHRSKISAYRDDIKRIQKAGVSHAELLPVPHSVEALFSQAENAATDILFAIEDVKQAVENERKSLAENYMQSQVTSGQSVSTVAEFYESLHRSPTYQSYIQAKDLFSYLEGYSSRFPEKSVFKLLKNLETAGKVDPDVVKTSQLAGFQKQFEFADLAIQEKTRAQLRLLQLQVRYSLATDMKGLQKSLTRLLQSVVEHKKQIVDYFDEDRGLKTWDPGLGLGGVDLFSFERNEDVEQDLSEEELVEEERRKLIEALLQAEEVTLKQIVNRFVSVLEEKSPSPIAMNRYQFKHGLAEYYVLAEIELFSKKIKKLLISESEDLEVSLKGQSVVIRDAEVYEYSLIHPVGTSY
jgi:hypothetical protein